MTKRPAEDGLPEGWVLQHSKSKNKPFYVHVATKKTQWHPPRAPAPAKPPKHAKPSKDSTRHPFALVPPATVAAVTRAFRVGAAQKQRNGSMNVFQPWPHQVRAVAKLVHAVSTSTDPGANYLIQHSTGSGKSVTLACLAYQLLYTSDASGHGFHTIIILVDRIKLDQQLGDTVEAFLHQNGMDAIYRAESIEHLSAIVRTSDDQKVIVTTTHKLSQLVNDKVLLARLLHASTASSSATYKHLAILADEAHRSHTSSTRVSIDTVLQALSTDACKTMYVGFSATPSVQALELFGSGVDPRAPFDTHSLTDAIAHKHIVDVLSHTTFLQSPLASPSIFAKVKSMMQHFVRLKTKTIFGKCLVVVRSRKDVVAYHAAIQSYMTGQGWPTHVYCTFSAFDGLSEKQLNTTCTLSLADVIVVCDKLDTGYNEPGLVAMYIDRPLSRHAHIVQLLSRLNRARDGKDRVHVVDYCNHPLTIRAAFAAYAHAKVLYTHKTDRRHWRRSYEMARLLLLETLPGYLFHGTAYLGQVAPPTPMQVAAHVGTLHSDVQSQIRFGLKTYVAASQALGTECSLLPLTWVEALKAELDRLGKDKTDPEDESTVTGSDEATFDVMYDGPLPFDSEVLRGRYGYLSALLSGDTNAACQDLRESPKDALDKRINSVRAVMQKGAQ